MTASGFVCALALVWFALQLGAAAAATATTAEYPLHTRCDLAPYFHRRPVWNDPDTPYAHVPEFPRPLLGASACPECAWDVVETYDPVCIALLAGTAYHPRSAERPRATGVCHFYPRLTPPGEPADVMQAYVATVAAGGQVDKFLPYFIPCSSVPAQAFKNNAIFYDFTGSAPRIGATVAGRRTQQTAAAGAGAAVQFQDLARDDATMTCTEFQRDGVPRGDPWDVLARNIEHSVSAVNTSTGDALDVGIVSRRHVKPLVPISTCAHANYALAAEIAAYPASSASEQQQEAEDAPLARDFWIQRRIVPAGAPVISGIPRQPEALPQQVTCGHEALYWTTKAAHRVFNPHITAHDPCIGAVPVHYEVLWAGLPNEPLLCPDRGTVMMRWIASDGCGNTAVASQAIRVYDDVPPVIPESDDLFICMGHDQLDSVVPTYTRPGRPTGTLKLGRRICLDTLLRRYIATIARDNCGLMPGLPEEQVVLDWDAIRVDQCAQPRGLQTTATATTNAHRRAAVSECAPTSAQPANTGCLMADDPRSIIPVWTRVTVPFNIYDACGNRNRLPYQVVLLVAPTPRACHVYGFKFLEYRKQD